MDKILLQLVKSCAQPVTFHAFSRLILEDHENRVFRRKIRSDEVESVVCGRRIRNRVHSYMYRGKFTTTSAEPVDYNLAQITRAPTRIKLTCRSFASSQRFLEILKQHRALQGTASRYVVPIVADT